MKISLVTRLGHDLRCVQETLRDANCVIQFHDDDGNLTGLRWPYKLNEQGLYSATKRKHGSWDGARWIYPTSSDAESMKELIRQKFPDLPFHPEFGPDQPERGIFCCVLPVGRARAACLLTKALSHFTEISLDFKELDFSVYKIDSHDSHQVFALVAPAEQIDACVDFLVEAGVVIDQDLVKKWGLSTNSKVNISTSCWAVQIKFDLGNPAHWALVQHRLAEGDVAGWSVIPTTRRKWAAWREKITNAGLQWEGEDPEAQELTVPAAFDESLVAGWDTPAPNGNLLHAYQKEGAQFCASRGMRALIGDEMGVGKTVQAIAAAEATAAQRIVVICPANARYVWDREIHGWGGNGAVQHIESQLDKLDMNARWHVITYDLIAARAETWRLNDDAEEKAFIEIFPELAGAIIKKGGYPHKVSLDQPLDKVPTCADPKRVAAWQKMMQRLKGELLEQVLSAGPVLVILDEAHRVKNRDAKRTKAIQRIAAGEARLLMLTGTPLRNNEHEAAILLSLLDASAAEVLSKKNGYTLWDVKEYLGYFMLRRTKADVLPELPEKTRQRIDIGDLDPNQVAAYYEAMALAQESYFKALEGGKSEAVARQSMQGGIERARKALGTAKVRGGEVVDLVLDVVENKACCVVFCAHRQVSDDLKAQLEMEKLRVEIIDGRVPPKKRAEIVADFQEGHLDVVIGSINAAGEAITLTRADTVIFVELDWVPAALLQAEDRIHRVGQRSNCQIIQLVARLPEGNNLDEIMVKLIGVKLARIGVVLDEDGNNIIAGSVQADLYSHLLGVAATKPVVSQVQVVDTQEQKAAGGKIAGELPDRKVDDAEPEQAATVAVVDQPKRKRGRPKVYMEKAPPTATERSKQSIKALTNAGGKRVMLRLNPEAHEALKVVMALTGGKQETATINQVLIDRKNELLRASTQN